MSLGYLERQKSIELGFTGEDLVAKLLMEQGRTVVKSSDRYDAEKDLTADGKYVEIKTQVPYRFFGTRKQPAFTVPIVCESVRRNQLNKCMNVDLLIFVKRPDSSDPVIRIYEAPPIGHRTFEIIQNKKDHRYVAGFYISTMTELGVITDPDIVQNFMEERKW